MKFFDTAEDILELAQDKFEDTNLPQMGVYLKVISVTKGKEILKIGRANATTEYITKKSDMCTLLVYEEAFDRLTDDYKAKLMEGALSNVSYDTEKCKLNVDTSKYGELFRMRRKYSNYVDIAEAAALTIEQIAEEEKERKEEEKARKAAEKEAKKNRR